MMIVLHADGLTSVVIAKDTSAYHSARRNRPDYCIWIVPETEWVERIVRVDTNTALSALTGGGGGGGLGPG